MRIRRWIWILIPLFLLTGCRPEVPEGTTTTAKVALIMPQPLWDSERAMVQGALATIRSAQQGMPESVAIEVEWIDEEAVNLSSEVSRIMNDPAYTAVIGPKYSRNARMVATASLRNRVPVLMPSVTSAEIQRIYAGSNKKAPNIFCMSESDLAQTQALMNMIKKQFLVERIILLSRGGDADDYVSSFTSYLPFVANELQFHSITEYTFSDKETLREAVRKIKNKGSKWVSAVIYIPSTKDDMLMLDEVINEEGAHIAAEYGSGVIDETYLPYIYCPDLACNALLEGRLTHEYRGTALSGNPESGFPAARKAQTGREIQSGYAQLYDCFSLLALALAHRQTAGIDNLCDAIVAVMNACDGTGDEFAWSADGLRTAFRDIRSGHLPTVAGASGSWVFDRETYISQLGSWYGFWRYFDGEYHLVEYLTRSDHAKQASMDQMWTWASGLVMSFTDVEPAVTYAPLEDRYAVVMATSTGWNNYRHQADALDIYRMLRHAGYDDEHIVLVTEDDLADNPQNPYPGVVHVTPDGENLHANIVNDYQISRLTPADLGNILSGTVTERTPQVVKGGKNTNVLFFWSGHGAYDGYINWGADHVTDEQIYAILQGAQDNFRKLLFVMETCYSGSIGENLPDIPGLLMLTACAPGEKSHADVIDGNIYLSNAFTRVFREEVEQTPSIAIYDLYTALARHTTASHAMIYNYEHYGSVYTNTMNEFFNKQP